MSWLGRITFDRVDGNVTSVFSAVLSASDSQAIIVLVWTVQYVEGDDSAFVRAILSRRLQVTMTTEDQADLTWLDDEPKEIARGGGTIIRGIETTDDGQLLIRLESMGSG